MTCCHGYTVYTTPLHYLTVAWRGTDRCMTDQSATLPLHSALSHSSWSTIPPFTQTLSGLMRLKVGLLVFVEFGTCTSVCVCTSVCGVSMLYLTYSTAVILEHAFTCTVLLSLLQRGEFVSVTIFNLTEKDLQVDRMVLSGYRVA